MTTILEFISIFQSTYNIELFTECACYYFAVILRKRFPDSQLMYNPHRVHFAVKIQDNIYDITGVVLDPYDYIEWRAYRESYDDAEFILHECMKLERR